MLAYISTTVSGPTAALNTLHKCRIDVRMACLTTCTAAALHVLQSACLQCCTAAQPSVMLSLCNVQAEATTEHDSQCLQMKRKAADCTSDPQASHSPSPAPEPAAMAATPLSHAEKCQSCPASPLAPTTPSPGAAERGSKRARRMPAAMADYMFE